MLVLAFGDPKVASPTIFIPALTVMQSRFSYLSLFIVA
jgi:hypothetical protein